MKGQQIFCSSSLNMQNLWCCRCRRVVCLKLPSRSQMTSKCGKNKKMAHEPLDECLSEVLYIAFWRLQWSIREFKKWRRQLPRQRHKLMIWLVEWGKIIVLHVRHDFLYNSWRSLPKDDVKFSYLRFWRQRKSAAINFSFSGFTSKAFVPKKQKVHFACFV